MNKNELNKRLRYFKEHKEEIGITVYTVLKNQKTPKQIDINKENLNDLKNIFINEFDKSIIKKDDISVMKLSSSDDRNNAFFEYDIEIPNELLVIQDITKSDNQIKFNFDNDSVNNVTALLIEIGDNERQIVLYKTMAQVNIYSRSSFFLKKSKTRFEKINDEFFRITPNFQLMQLDECLIVLDLATIEKFFGFHDVIKREATAGLDAINKASLLENPETLNELVDDISFARKLVKVAKASPVLKAEVPNNKIIEFCKTFPHLKGKIRFNNDESKIQLDTKVSKELFVKLLMDDFLTSELTNFHYTSLAKDEVDNSDIQNSNASQQEQSPEAA